MKITKENRKCLIPDNYFYSIPFEATGGKLIVIASNKKKAQKLLKQEIKSRGGR